MSLENEINELTLTIKDIKVMLKELLSKEIRQVNCLNTTTTAVVKEVTKPFLEDEISIEIVKEENKLFKNANEFNDYVLKSYQSLGSTTGKKINGIMKHYGYDSMSEIKEKDYMLIYDDIERLKNE